MKKREIKPNGAQLLKPKFAVTEAELSDPRKWLQDQAREHSLKLEWLLAHADDGVNWGSVDEQGALIISRDALEKHRDDGQGADYDKDEVRAALDACPPLRAATLQQARLFGAKAELLLWRDGDNQFYARIIADTAADAPDDAVDWREAYDEAQMLWGSKNNSIALPHGFTLWRDGAQGLRHAAPPFDGANETAPPRLVVRHYLAKKEVFARVVVSRLIGFAPAASLNQQ
ncbi:MAG: type III-D CRISPR-associated protein Csx19 [Blastocatellia bacterium]